MLQLFVGAKTVLITSTHVLHLTALATGRSVIKIVNVFHYEKSTEVQTAASSNGLFLDKTNKLVVTYGYTTWISGGTKWLL
jgi:hypothetical protein